MITVAEIVQQLIRQSPFVSEALSEGLVNVSALARKLQPDVQHLLGKPVKVGAIVMAINRQHFGDVAFVEKNLRRFFKKLSNYSVRSNLTSFTYSNSETLAKCQLDLLQIISEHPKMFYTFSQGVSETTVITANTVLENVEEIFRAERLISKEVNLSSITLMLPDENQMIYGIYYYILKDLAWFGINLAEVISTSNEFTLIVDAEDLDQTFSILMKLKGT
ncbi:MAG: hypothetical protein ACJAUH_000628 [Saprospiraceae bacterium]|jgi:hypothetical protein